MRTLAFALSIVAASLIAPLASAQETGAAGGAVELGPPVTSDNLVDPRMGRSWSEGRPRKFASLLVDAGYLYLRPRGAIGYGKPFTSWIGLEANPLILGAGVGGYAGARFAVPYVDLRVGARYFLAFQHSYLRPERSFDRLELDLTTEPRAKMLTYEAELNVAVPLGPGDVIGTASLSYVTGIPAGYFVFEETLHVVVDPPLLWRGRAGYTFRFGSHGQHSIGPVFDVLDVPKRDDSITFRLGPVFRIQLSRRFDLRGSFVTTFVSPDRLGLVGGDFTELGLRYRTATE